MKCFELSDDTLVVVPDNVKFRRPYYGRRRYTVIIIPDKFKSKFVVTKIKSMLKRNKGSQILVVGDKDQAEEW